MKKNTAMTLPPSRPGRRPGHSCSLRRAAVPFAGLMIGAAALATGGAANAAVSPHHQPAATTGYPAATTRAGAPQDRGTVTFTDAFTRTLRSAGIGLAPIGGAHAATSHHRRAVTMRLAREDARGKSFLLSGGIQLTKGKSSLALSRWGVDLGAAKTTAAINHGAPAVVFHLGRSHRRALGQARIELNRRSAAAMNAAFGTHRFHNGATLGYFRQPPLLGSGYSDVENITIYNLSRYNLKISSIDTHDVGTWTSDPPHDLSPGQQQTATYGTNYSQGADVTLNYLIDGTPHIITGEFGIPTIGFNWAKCSQDDFVTQIGCSNGSGWNTKFKWTIGTNETTGPFFDLGPAGTAWQFHRLDAPNLRLQTYGADPDNGQILDIETKNSQPNQNWIWYPDAAGDGWGQLRNGNSHKCMEENGSDGVADQWDCVDGATNQLWKPVYDPAGGSALQVKSSLQYLTTKGTTSGTAQAELAHALNRASSWGANRP